MSAPKSLLVVYPSVGCTMCAMLPACIQMMMYFSSTLDQIDSIANLEMAQLKLHREWSDNKFIDSIFVVNSDTSCESGAPGGKPLFTYDFFGLRSFYEREDENGNKVYTLRENNGASKNQKHYPLVQPGFPMIQAEKIGAQKICAKTQAKSFKDISWKKMGGGCLNGFMECPEGPATDASEKYCVPEGGKCPITDIYIKKKADAGKVGYEYQDLNENYQVGVSRQANSLPLTEFMASPATPCIGAATNPWTDNNFGQWHYMNEYEAFEIEKETQSNISSNNCMIQIDENGNSVYQNYARYNILNRDTSSLQISLFELEKQNGIDEIFAARAANYPNADIVRKKENSKVFLWSAPPLTGSEKITDENSPDAIFGKLDQINKLLKGGLETESRYIMTVRVVLIFFSLWPFAGVMMLFSVQKKPLFFFLAMVFPMIFIWRSVTVWSAINTDRANFDTQLQDKLDLQAYIKTNIQPLVVLFEPLSVVIAEPSLAIFITFEVLIFLVIFTYYGAVCAVLKDEIQEAFSEFTKKKDAYSAYSQEETEATPDAEEGRETVQ